MSFLLLNKGLLKGLFIHTPKCSGTSAQLLFKSLDLDLWRPRKEWIGHYGLDRSLSLLSRLAHDKNKLGIPKDLRIYIILRDPQSWLSSMYSYALKTKTTITGLRKERHYFLKYGLEKYLHDYIEFSSLGYVKTNRGSLDPAESLAFRPFTHYFVNDSSGTLQDNFKMHINIFDSSRLDLLRSSLIDTFELKTCSMEIPTLNVTHASRENLSHINTLLQSNPALAEALRYAMYKDQLAIWAELIENGHAKLPVTKPLQSNDKAPEPLITKPLVSLRS